MEKRSLRVIWALDPFEQATEPNPCLRAGQLLASWASKAALSIQPVYVLNPDQLNARDEIALPWIYRYKAAAERAVNQVLSRVEVRTEPPHVLIDEFGSTLQAVDTVARHAISVEADVIITHTHAREGLQRFLFGSFTETLLERSQVPVIVVSPTSRLSVDQETILFSTDFDPVSRSAYREIVSLCDQMGAKLLLHHCEQRPVEPVFQTGVYLLGGTWIPVQSYYLAEKRKVQRRARLWTRWAVERGVNAELLIQKEGGDVADCILSLARSKHAGLIAIESRKRALSAAIGGSIAREVIRHAPCPVWVSRPGARTGAKLLPGRAA